MGKPVNKTLRIAAMSAGEEIGHVSGPIVTFRGNGDPLRSLVANIEPVQDLHGYDSPWPAGGGMNLFQTTATSKTQAGVTWTVNADGSITVAGTATGYSDLLAGEANVAGLSETVTINGDISNAGNVVFGVIRLSDSNDQTLATIYSGGLQTTHTVDLTQYNDANKIVVYLKRNNNIETSGTYHIQVVKGTTVPAWTPYSNICPISGWDSVDIMHSGADTSDPTVYTITLGQTVYGGTLDVTNGVMVVSHAVIKLGNWMKGLISNYSSKNGYYYNGANLTPPMASGSFYSDPDTICSHFAKKPNADSGMGMWIGANSTYFYFAHVTENIPNIETSAKFCEWLEANDVFMTYPLATPITIPLTATEISSLQGENNVWADSGDVDVEYIATGGEGGKLALLLRNRKELLIALRKGLSPAEVGLLGSIPSFGGFVRPGLSTDDEKEEDELI